MNFVILIFVVISHFIQQILYFVKVLFFSYAIRFLQIKVLCSASIFLGIFCIVAM